MQRLGLALESVKMEGDRGDDMKALLRAALVKNNLTKVTATRCRKVVFLTTDFTDSSEVP